MALSAMHTITSSGTGRGGASGQPATQFTLTFTNKSGSAVSIDGSTVTVADADGTYSWSEDSPDNGDDAPAAGTVAAGQSVQGKYVFVVPPAEQGQHNLPILISISVTGAPNPPPFSATVN